MSAGGVVPCGSSRLLRLDPFALPIQFRAKDAAADECVRFVELHRERVVMRRSLAGMRMAISFPVSCFLGVALRVVPPGPAGEGAVAIVLEHRDAALAITLFTAPDGVDAIAEWRAWGRVLGLRLLVADADGTLREPFPPMRSQAVARPKYRGRRGSVVKRRRPRILTRRAVRLAAAPRIHRDEREIIARN